MNEHIYFLLILFNKNYNKHFLKRYVKLALFFKERNFKKAKGLHYHHIIPDSFDGAKSNENMVYITPREHFILHWMLYKAFPKSGMATAFFAMCNGWDHYASNKVTSKVYENLMIESRKKQSEMLKKRVAEGIHQWQGPDNNNKRITEGTHPWLGGELQREAAKKRVESGTHHWQDKEKASQREKNKVEEGRHNFQDKEKASQREKNKVEEGTHPFLGGEIQRKMNKKRVDNGTHPFSRRRYTKRSTK
jgi:hypothetical protein